MVYDFRQYTFRPGAIPDYMKAVEELSIPIRARYGVKLAGWYYSEVGELNQVVHIWGYRDYDHFDEARAQVARDPDWTGQIPAGSARPDSQPEDLVDALARLRSPAGVAD